MDPIYKSYLNEGVDPTTQNLNEIFKEILKKVDEKYKGRKGSLLNFSVPSSSRSGSRLSTFRGTPDVTVNVSYTNGEVNVFFHGATSGISSMDLKLKFNIGTPVDDADSFDKFESGLEKAFDEMYKKWWPKFEAYRKSYSNYVKRTGDMT